MRVCVFVLGVKCHKLLENWSKLPLSECAFRCRLRKRDWISTKNSKKREDDAAPDTTSKWKTKITKLSRLSCSSWWIVGKSNGMQSVLSCLIFTIAMTPMKITFNEPLNRFNSDNNNNEKRRNSYLLRNAK